MGSGVETALQRGYQKKSVPLLSKTEEQYSGVCSRGCSDRGGGRRRAEEILCSGEKEKGAYQWAGGSGAAWPAGKHSTGPPLVGKSHPRAGPRTQWAGLSPISSD